MLIDFGQAGTISIITRRQQGVTAAAFLNQRKGDTMTDKPLPKGITLRKDGRYMGRFMYRGEKYTVYGENPRKVKKELDNLRYEVEHSMYEKPSNITVDAWFWEWISTYKSRTIKPTTLERYQSYYKNHLQTPLGNKRLVDIRANDIQKILNAMADQNFAKGTIKLARVALNGMFEQARKNKLIKENPLSDVTIPNGAGKRQRSSLTRQEQGLVLEYVGNYASRFYTLYALALCTGMRQGELLGLRWQDIDFSKRVIHVTGTLTKLAAKGSKPYRTTPKTRTSYRDIPMTKESYEILKCERKEQLRIKMQQGEQWKPLEGLEDLVFLSRTGKPRLKDNIGDANRRIIKRIQKNGKEITPFTFHSLRHTFATRAIENGMNPQTLKAILGHSSLSMTMDLYSHVMEDTKAEEMEKIGDML